jgi:hypothetical protein
VGSSPFFPNVQIISACGERAELVFGPQKFTGRVDGIDNKNFYFA